MASELINLRKAYAAEGNLEVRERIQMVIASYEGTLRDACRRFACTHGKIWYWRMRYERESISGLRTRSREGRPPKMSERETKLVWETVEKESIPGGWQTKAVRQLIFEKAGALYSERQVIRLMHKWGFSRIKPRKQHVLSNKAEQRRFLKKPAKP